MWPMIWLMLFSGVIYAQKNHGSSFDDDKTNQDKFSENSSFNAEEKFQPQPPPEILRPSPAISSPSNRPENWASHQQTAVQPDSSISANNFQLLPPVDSSVTSFIDRMPPHQKNIFPPAPSVKNFQQQKSSTLFKPKQVVERLQTPSSTGNNQGDSLSPEETAGPVVVPEVPEVQHGKSQTRQKKVQKPFREPVGPPQQPLLQVEPLAPMPNKNKIGGNLNIDSMHFPALPKIADLGSQHGHEVQVEQVNIEDQLPVILPSPADRKLKPSPQHPKDLVDPNEHEETSNHQQQHPFDANKFANLVNEKFSYIIKNLSESGYLTEMDVADENVIKNISNSFAEYVEKTLKIHPVNTAAGLDENQEQILDVGADHVISDFKNRLAIPIFGPPGHKNGEILEAKPPIDNRNSRRPVTTVGRKLVQEKLDKTNLSPSKLPLEKPTTLPAFGGMATKISHPPSAPNLEKEEEEGESASGNQEPEPNQEHTILMPPVPDKTENTMISGQKSSKLNPLNQRTKSRPTVAGAEEIPIDETINGPQPPVVFGSMPFDPVNRTRIIQIPENSRFFGAATESLTEPTSKPLKTMSGPEKINVDEPREINPESQPEFAAEQHETDEVVQKATTPLVLVRIPVRNATSNVQPDNILGERPNFSFPKIDNIAPTVTDTPDLLRFINGSFANVPPLRMPPKKSVASSGEVSSPPGIKPDFTEQQVATSESGFNRSISQPNSDESTSPPGIKPDFTEQQVATSLSGFNRSISQPNSGESTSFLDNDNVTTTQLNISQVSTFPTPPNWNFPDNETSLATVAFGELSTATSGLSKETMNATSTDESLSTGTESTIFGNGTVSDDNGSTLFNNTSTHASFILGETEEVTNFTAEHTFSTESTVPENTTSSFETLGTETGNASLPSSISGNETLLATTIGSNLTSTTNDGFSILETGSVSSNLTLENYSTTAPNEESTAMMINGSLTSMVPETTGSTPVLVFNFTTFNESRTSESNVTLVSMVLFTSTEKPPEGIASWKLRLTSIEWDTGLNDKNSWQYKNLYETIYPELEKTFQGILKENYVKTTITRFSAGSVIVSGQTESRAKIDYQQFTDEFEKSLKATSYKLSHYAVDPSSINVENPGASAPQLIEPSTAGKAGGMPGYVIAIIVAAIILLAALLAAAFYVRRYRTRRLREDNYMVDEETMGSGAGHHASRAVKNWQRPAAPAPPANGQGPPRPSRLNGSSGPRAEMSASMNIYEMKDQSAPMGAMGVASAHVNHGYQADTRGAGANGSQRTFQDVDLRDSRINEESSIH